MLEACFSDWERGARESDVDTFEGFSVIQESEIAAECQYTIVQIHDKAPSNSRTNTDGQS
jgi:hypothetical protein